MLSRRLIILTVELLFVSCTVAAPTFISTTSSFDDALGTLVLNRIIAGKQLKVSSEKSQKLTFEQDATCNNCNSYVGSGNANGSSNANSSTNDNKPILVNYGASVFVAACNDPAIIMTGPRFALSSSTYYLSLAVLNSDTSTALGGTKNYLTFNSDTGYLQKLTTPSYDVTQVYMASLINKLTGASTDPVYFTAKLLGCSLSLAGPSSVRLCTGYLTTLAPTPASTPAPTRAPTPTPPVLGNSAAMYMVSNPGVSLVLYDASTCPIVTASSNSDFTACYISTSSISNTAKYVIGPVYPPQVSFTQSLTITATPAQAGNFFAGTKSIDVTFDPTCIALSAAVAY